jgi:hypothetical protein
LDVEFHQLDLRFEHLRVHRPDRERRLLASLAASGQHVPIVVVAVREQPERYLVIACGAAEPYNANLPQKANQAVLGLLKEAGKSQACHCPAFRILQFLPRSQKSEGYACDGSGNC